MTSFTDRILDGIFLLEQINFVCGSWYTATDQAIFSPFIPINKNKSEAAE